MGSGVWLFWDTHPKDLFLSREEVTNNNSVNEKVANYQDKK